MVSEAKMLVITFLAPLLGYVSGVAFMDLAERGSCERLQQETGTNLTYNFRHGCTLESK